MASPPRIRLVSSVPCPPTPTIMIFFTAILLTLPYKLYGVEFTQVFAQPASGAHWNVDVDRAVRVLCHGRTSRLHAGGAFLTFIRMSRIKRFLPLIKKNARRLCNDHRDLIFRHFLFNRLLEKRQVERIDLVYIFNAH